MNVKKKLGPIVTGFFSRGRNYKKKKTIRKDKKEKAIRLDAIDYSIKETSNKRKFQQIAPIHLSDSDFKDFMKDIRSYKQPYSF